jgi:dolichyl-phosphate-mannose--protein O-mannosyl transferase
MAAYSFAILALAWIIDECLKSRFQVDRITGVGILVLITLSFIYWLPIYLGIPLSEIGFKMRIFLPNWV